MKVWSLKHQLDTSVCSRLGLLFALCAAMLPWVLPGRLPHLLPSDCFDGETHSTLQILVSNFSTNEYFCDKALQISSCLLPSPSIKELRASGQQSSSPNRSMDIQHHPCPCLGFFKNKKSPILSKKWADSLWAWSCNTDVLSLHGQIHLHCDTLDTLAHGIKRRRK